MSLTEKELYVGTTKKSPTVLSLCSGYGGLEIGISRALGECTVLAHVEIEAFAVANLVNKMETGRMVPGPIWTDLKTFDATVFRGRVDILTGGYPCQPFSAAGKRRGTDDPRHLWPHIGGKIDGRRNIIEQCRPRYVFFENVEGHLSLGIAEVLEDLEKMGYRVEVGIFSAVEVGAPHQRKRVFILGELADTESQRPGTLGAEHEVRERRSATTGAGVNRTQWPARPGENQYEWEEPRVVADNISRKLERGARVRISRRIWEQEQTEENMSRGRGNDESEETKPGVGRKFNGTSNRVDRLRLLGNGVVPQVAEKAFTVLFEKLWDFERAKDEKEV